MVHFALDIVQMEGWEGYDVRRYGEERYDKQLFTLRCLGVERRGQWVDVGLSLQLMEGETLPHGLVAPSVLVICVPTGEVVQIVLQDEGCDSEFQFTPAEEEIVRSYIRDHCEARIRSV